MKQDYKEYEEKIKMNDNLKFDAERGETRTYEAAGKKSPAELILELYTVNGQPILSRS